MMDPVRLAGWVPIRIGWRASGPFVDWCHLGGTRFAEPFFEQTIERCLRNPATLVFRHETPIEVLADWPVTEPGGFILHMSRCGSTLLAQMLAALPRNVVISEAPPVDSIVRAAHRDPGVTDEQRIAWLRGLLSAFAQPGCRVFVKFDAWHTLDLPLIRRVFPSTPWIFLCRDPVEVLVSQLRQRGALMVPGMIDLALPGLVPAAALAMPPEEYCSRVLGRICEAAVAGMRLGGGRVIDYADLPGALTSEVAPFFGLDCTPEEATQMREVAQFDAKTPGLYFERDSETKQRTASAAEREMAARWIGPAWDELRALGASQLKIASK
jgi:hypothetical protein